LENTIKVQRRAIARHLAKNPGLKRVEAGEYNDAFEAARLGALTETDMELSAFHDVPPFTMEQAKDEAWWPV
jgi:hypothetical protein